MCKSIEMDFVSYLQMNVKTNPKLGGKNFLIKCLFCTCNGGDRLAHIDGNNVPYYMKAHSWKL
jgi:hypothetical protein